MITAYTGTPGSGKSVHSANEIWDQITLRKKPIIYNKYLNPQLIIKKLGKKGNEKIKERLLLIPNSELKPKVLIDYAVNYHHPEKEHQTLIIFEEAADFFSKEEFKFNPDCFQWRKFFREHRQYGFDIILITQRLNWIDGGIAGCVEREINHRAVANFKKFGKIVSFFSGGLFSYSQRWVAVRPSIREKGGMFKLHKKRASIIRTTDALASKKDKTKKFEKHPVISDFLVERNKPAEASSAASVV